MHRVLVYDSKQCDIAFNWLQSNLASSDWSNEIFDNFDCFYFTNATICSIFVFVNGGKYIAPPRGSSET